MLGTTPVQAEVNPPAAESPVPPVSAEAEVSREPVSREPVSCEESASSDEAAPDDRGGTALHLAAAHGQEEATAALLAQGSEVMARDRDGRTPLHRAALCGSIEVAELLLNHGADVNARNDFGLTALHTAATFGLTDVAELFIARGADVNAADNFGDTPLRSALEHHAEEIADWLRQRGAVEPAPRAEAPAAVFAAPEAVEPACQTPPDGALTKVVEDNGSGRSWEEIAAFLGHNGAVEPAPRAESPALDSTDVMEPTRETEAPAGITSVSEDRESDASAPIIAADECVA